jgi:hypothetical protein
MNLELLARAIGWILSERFQAEVSVDVESKGKCEENESAGCSEAD